MNLNANGVVEVEVEVAVVVVGNLLFIQYSYHNIMPIANTFDLKFHLSTILRVYTFF